MCSNKILDVRVTVETGEEPVSLDDAKSYMNVDYSEKDSIIQQLIVAARQILEAKYDIGIKGKTLQVVLDNSCGDIELPGYPIGIVTGVNESGDAIAITTIGTDIKYIKSPCACYLKVSYTSGYAVVSDIPYVLRNAIKQQVLWMYEHLGDEDMMDKVCPMAAMSLKPFRRNGIGVFI